MFGACWHPWHPWRMGGWQSKGPAVFWASTSVEGEEDRPGAALTPGLRSLPGHPPSLLLAAGLQPLRQEGAVPQWHLSPAPGNAPVGTVISL